MKASVVCSVCGTVFERTQAELKRNAKKNRRVFCSRSCSGRGLIAENMPDAKRTGWHLGLVNHGDEYSRFRVFLHRIGGRKKSKECDLSLEYLKELWDSQDGVCPYTGWKLKTPDNTHKRIPVTPELASIDRIDSSKGYVRGNVQFVSYMANCAKNCFGTDDLLRFCRAVANHQLPLAPFSGP